MQNLDREWQALFGISDYLPSWLDRASSAFAAAGCELPKERLLAAAYTALEQGRPGDALRAFEAAGASPPHDELAQCGNRCLDSRRLDEAVRVFTLLDDFEHLRDCANAFLAKGDIPKARFLFHYLGTSLPLEKVREFGDACFKNNHLTGAIQAYSEINDRDRLETCAQECPSAARVRHDVRDTVATIVARPLPPTIAPPSRRDFAAAGGNG